MAVSNLERHRRLSTWLGLPFRKRHYRAAFRARQICARPFDLLRRYAGLGGDYPASIELQTPIGQLPLTLYTWHDARTIHEIFLAEDYRIGPNDKIIVDYGSNIGISAGYFLSRAPDSRAYLFEPVPQNVERLRKNLEKFSGQFELQEIAVGTRNGSVSFGIEDTGRYGGIGLQTGRYLKVESRDSNDILAEIVARHGRIDVLKVDVETLERALVEHLTPELASKIGLVLVEHRFADNPLAASHDMVLQGTVARFVRR